MRHAQRVMKIDPPRLKRVAVWALINGSAMVAFWLGGYEGVGWAKNIALFYVWAVLLPLAILATIIARATTLALKGEITVSDDKTLPDLSTFYRSVPKWLDVGYDIGALLLLAGAGWFFTAGAYGVHIVLHALALQAAEEGAEIQRKAEARSSDPPSWGGGA